MYAPYEEQEIQELKSAIQRVRELHKNKNGLCNACEDTYESSGLKDYPCPTIKALDGEQ